MASGTKKKLSASISDSNNKMSASIDMEADDGIRRSSRSKRNSKSALELLGVSPRKDRATKPVVTPQTKKLEDKKPARKIPPGKISFTEKKVSEKPSVSTPQRGTRGTHPKVANQINTAKRKASLSVDNTKKEENTERDTQLRNKGSLKNKKIDSVTKDPSSDKLDSDKKEKEIVSPQIDLVTDTETAVCSVEAYEGETVITPPLEQVEIVESIPPPSKRQKTDMAIAEEQTVTSENTVIVPEGPPVIIEGIEDQKIEVFTPDVKEVTVSVDEVAEEPAKIHEVTQMETTEMTVIEIPETVQNETEPQGVEVQTHETQDGISNENDPYLEIKESEEIPVQQDEEETAVVQKKKKGSSKKIVKAVIITPSGERKEIRLGPHVSTIKALEHILAGTTSGTEADVAQLAVDVSKQIEASMMDVDNTETGEPELTETTQTVQDDGVQIVHPDVEESQDCDADVSTARKLANVDSDHKIAFEALSQLASGNSKDIPLTIELDETGEDDPAWLHQVAPLDNEDKVWHRQMVGVEDQSMASSTGGLRARPEKHVVASFDLEKMIQRLEPDDCITNHVYRVPIGTVSQMNCKHCDKPIADRHDFRRHMTTHKDVEFKPWKCPICHYRAAVRAQIARHVNIHGELKPYVCRECGKGFNFKQKLVQHLKYHLDIRDKPCPYCNLAFHEHKTLKNHIRKIHGIEKALPKDDSVGKPTETAENAMTEEQEEPGETKVFKPDSQAPTPESEHVSAPTDPAVEESTVEISAVTPALDELRATKKRPRRPSLLYGTRKTFLYTQQYKMGLLPAADRNNVPTSAVVKFPETSAVDTLTEEEELKKSPKPASNKATNAALIGSLLEQYCRVEEEMGKSVSFFCKFCDIESFSSRTGFLHHLEQKHPDIRAWKCPSCDYSCRMRSSLIVHMKIHTGVKDYHCEVCGKSFAFKQKLKNHLKHHMNLREFPCDLCDKAFNEKNDLTKHVRKVHIAERHCVCEVCNKAFKDVIQLRRHADSHTGDTKKYLCQHCNKYYRSKVSLAQHMKSHTCMFHCEICDKDFGSYSGFMAHKVMHDESFEGYECEICKKILHTKGSLTRHLAVAHSNDRPFACTECAKTFKTKKDLKNHKIVHTTERNFSCELCDFSSKRFESLRVHQRRHAEVKPYQCGMCGKEYTQKHALETHLRHHTGDMEASCPICGREFFTRYQLETHLKRKHPSAKEELLPGPVLEGDQPVTVFMCEECNAVFMTQDSLAIHILAEHMKQGWNTGVVQTTEGSIAEESGTTILPNQSSTEAMAEASIANTVEVMTESDGVLTQSRTPSSANAEHTNFNEQTIELVSITEPGSRKQRLVSLIRPIETQDHVEEGGGEISAQTAASSESTNGEEKINLLVQAPAEHQTYVAISDPSSNQEMLVAMPHANFESLLAASEIEAQNMGTYIDAGGENYITVSATDGTITGDGFVIAESSSEVEERVVTMTNSSPTETEEHQQTYVAVAETIEIPIETESVTV